MKKTLFMLILLTTTNAFSNTNIFDIVNYCLNEKDVEKSKIAFKGVNMTENEEDSVLNLLINIKSEKLDRTERTILANLFYSFSLNAKKMNNKQEALYQDIDMYWISYQYFSHNEYSKELYTQRTLSRIAEVVSGPNSTEKEIIIYDRVEDLFSSSRKKYEEEFLKIYENTGMPMNVYMDSVKTSIYNRIVNRTFGKDFYDQTFLLVKVLGWLYYKEAIPILQEKLLLSSSSYRYNEALIHALARMGDENSLQKIYERKSFSFIYLNTREAYWRYIENNYVFDKYRNCMSFSPPQKEIWPASNSAISTVALVSRFIKNFPDKLKINYYCIDEKDKEEVEHLTKEGYKWLKKNKNKYVLIDDNYIKF